MNKQLNQLSICVVNYNGREYLPACLNAILFACPDPREIIVVDNASEDSSADLVARDFPQVKLVRLPENLGPGAARNVAYAQSAGVYVLFVDNDVRVTGRCVQNLLLALLDHSETAVAMPRVCYADRTDTIQYDGAGCHPIGLMTLYNQNVPVGDAETSVRFMHSVVTACILIDKSTLGMSEPFDESFFFNYEDHDFGFRCSLSGRRIISVPAAVCYHGPGTEGLSYRKNGTYTDRRVYYLIRNRWQILLKDYQLRTLVVLSPILILFEICQFGGMVAKGWGVQWLKSAWWIVTHLPRILHKRREVQRTRRLSDMGLFDICPLPLTDALAGGRWTRRAISFLDNAILGYLRLINPAPRQQVGNRE